MFVFMRITWVSHSQVLLIKCLIEDQQVWPPLKKQKCLHFAGLKYSALTQPRNLGPTNSTKVRPANAPRYCKKQTKFMTAQLEKDWTKSDSEWRSITVKVPQNYRNQIGDLLVTKYVLTTLWSHKTVQK